MSSLLTPAQSTTHSHRWTVKGDAGQTGGSFTGHVFGSGSSMDASWSSHPYQVFFYPPSFRSLNVPQLALLGIHLNRKTATEMMQQAEFHAWGQINKLAEEGQVILQTEKLEN